MFLLVAVNLLGVAVGIIFYYPQLASANPAFWIFIPDCPLYILLATFFYLRILKNDLLRAITAVGLLKYGLWTIFALFHFSEYFLSNALGWVLVFEHIGMMLQYALFAAPMEKKSAYIAAGWFLLNDFVDYVFGVHAFLPSNDLWVIVAFSLASSLAIPAFVFFYGKKIASMRIVKSAKSLLHLHYI